MASKAKKDAVMKAPKKSKRCRKHKKLKDDFDLSTVLGFQAFRDAKFGQRVFVPHAFAFGIATVKDLKTIVDVQFHWGVNFGADSAPGVAAALDDQFDGTLNGTRMLLGKFSNSGLLDYFECFEGDGKKHANIEAIKDIYNFKQVKRKDMIAGHCQVPVVVSIDDLNEAPVDAGDAYLRLHLLSMLKVKPNTINLEGIFGLLNTNCWTNVGVFDADSMDEVRLHFFRAGLPMPSVKLRDKFPHLLDYVTPKGVRIGDGARVRLGAHLEPGTTVMQEGFVNFNAGTVNYDDDEVFKAIIEGRVSQGVIIGNGTDVGGGASTQGTLSGGGTDVLSFGKYCLLGANSGAGISFGDWTYLQAGHDVMPGHVVVVDSRQWEGNELMQLALKQYGDLMPRRKCMYTIRAKYLSGISWAVFRFNTVKGRSEVVPNTKAIEKLNDELHAHN